MAVQQITPTIKDGHMASPSLSVSIDFTVFKKTMTEKSKLYGLKQRWIKKGGLKKFLAKQYELHEKFSF